MRILNKTVFQVDSQTSQELVESELIQPDISALALLERDQVTLPICAQENPSDTVLYEDPNNSSSLYYLPRYELVTEQVFSETRYRIEFEESDGRTTLSVYVRAYMAPELDRHAGVATALEHVIEAQLDYQQGDQIITRQFDEIQVHGSDQRLTIRIASIEERDRLFAAISEHDFTASLIVQRAINIALPVVVNEPVSPLPETRYTVELMSVGNLIETIKVLRKWTGVGLKEAKKLTDHKLPVVVTNNINLDRAKGFVSELIGAGSKAKVQKYIQGTDITKPDKPSSKKVDVQLTKIGFDKPKTAIILEKFTDLNASEIRFLLGKPLPIMILKSADIRLVKELVTQLELTGSKVSIRNSGLFNRLTKPFSLFTVIEPELEFLGVEKTDIRGVSFQRYYLSVINASGIPVGLFQPAPDLPPCGRNTNSSRTWVDIFDQNNKRLYGFCNLSNPSTLEKFSFNIKEGATQPERLRISLTDRRTKQVYNSNWIDLNKKNHQNVTKYSEGHHKLNFSVAPEPFCFDTRLHSYIYPFLGNQQGTQLIRKQISWEGRPHSYFVDAKERNQVFYLPDEFKLSRKDTVPYNPSMSVHIKSREDDSELADATISYLAVPVTDDARLNDAISVLNEDLQPEDPPIELQPYDVLNFSFTVNHPTETGGSKSAEQNVSGNIFYQGIQNTLIMSFADFVACFAAMTGQTNSKFHGTVSVNLADDIRIDLPFNADLSDMAGDIFDYVAIENEDGSVALTLLNAIESPLALDNLAIELKKQNQSSNTELVSDPVLPTNLNPGESIAITATPESAFDSNESLIVEIDNSNVSVTLDSEAVWNVIADRSSTEYFRMITVRVTPNLFVPKPSRESEAIIAVIVNFEGGQSVELSEDQTQAQARVDYLVDDLILRDETSIKFRYSFQIARANSDNETVENQEERDEMFFLDVSSFMSEGDE